MTFPGPALAIRLPSLETTVLLPLKSKAPVPPQSDDQLALLARGLRPFILRRTKDQVASELPSKTEQTIFCELEAGQQAGQRVVGR